MQAAVDSQRFEMSGWAVWYSERLTALNKGTIDWELKWDIDHLEQMWCEDMDLGRHLVCVHVYVEAHGSLCKPWVVKVTNDSLTRAERDGKSLG